MQLIRGFQNLCSHHQGCAVTIGNFDGVHTGHVAVLNGLKKYAGELDIPTLVIVFEPQPLELFQPDKAPARLSKLTDKITLLEKQGIDYVLCAYFKDCLKSLPAEEFVDKILKQALAAKFVMVGDDFRFGRGCGGDFSLLKKMSKGAFRVIDTSTLCVTDQRVSSTRIRQLLAEGDFQAANQLLGYRYSMNGRVANGQRLGRTLGVPTANVALKRVNSPLHGVYAVLVLIRVDEDQKQTYQGVANVGIRPTVNGKQSLLEAHLFNFNGDLYGKKITVQFEYKIRNEVRFDSIDDLKQQIYEDINTAQQYFSKASA